MTKTERELVDRLDGVLRGISSLQPQNPMNSTAKSANLDLATKAATHAVRAISAWRFADLDLARRELTDAEGTLAEGLGE